MNVYLESPWDLQEPALECWGGGRILVADDEEILRECVSAALTRHGFLVDAVEDGGAAWQALQSSQYDALVTDHNMPVLTGMDLVRKLRSVGKTLPVIMASGSLQELPRNPWLQSVTTLAKPFSSKQLLDMVNHVLHGRRPASFAGLNAGPGWREGF
jgi:two-component system copper resistance phosphate regulon response regulator CusR